MGYQIYKNGSNFGGCAACGGFGEVTADDVWNFFLPGKAAAEAQLGRPITKEDFTAALDPLPQATAVTNALSPIATAAAAAALAAAEAKAGAGATSSVTGLLLMVGAVGAGLWLLLGGKKKARRNPCQRRRSR